MLKFTLTVETDADRAESDKESVNGTIMRTLLPFLLQYVQKLVRVEPDVSPGYDMPGAVGACGPFSHEYDTERTAEMFEEGDPVRVRAYYEFRQHDNVTYDEKARRWRDENGNETTAPGTWARKEVPELRARVHKVVGSEVVSPGEVGCPGWVFVDVVGRDGDVDFKCRPADVRLLSMAEHFAERPGPA